MKSYPRVKLIVANVIVPVVFLLMDCALALAAGAPAPIAIPLKPDPPPAVDGMLNEWVAVPNAIRLDRPAQVVYGASKWTSPADLSATVWLAWHSEHLYLAVDVTDDKLQQKERGADMYRGDHIELYLDATPDSDPERTTFGKGQFQFGFSPGNFQHTGDPLFDLKPEAVVFRPTGMAAEGVLVGAQRTDHGYSLEAAVPWKLLGITPAVGTPLAVEVGVSDTDSDEPAQESLMTILTTPWAFSRTRWVPAVLAEADGKPPVVVRGAPVFDQVKLAPGARQEIRFNAPPVPAGRDAVLSLKARLATPKPAGYTAALRLILNGTPLDGKRLLNKQLTEERANGATQNMAAGDRFTTGYAPDFDSPDKDPHYGLKHAKVCDFDLRVTDLLKPGANILVVQNAIAAPLTNELIAADAHLSFRAPEEVSHKQGPPTGPLPEFAPETRYKTAYQLTQRPDGTLEVTVGGQTVQISSQFSTPAPRWEHGSNSYFRLQRQVEQKNEEILVRDTFTNLTDNNLPIMQRHYAALAGNGEWRQIWLGGLSPASRTGAVSEPANPTSFGVAGDCGIGLLPLDDVFQVHVTNFSDGKLLGLADNEFVLQPHASHTAEWAIVPTSRPDYFAFVNAVRRLRDVNFTINGSFAFLRVDPRNVDTWTDDHVVKFARSKAAKYLCNSITYPLYHGHYPHGTAFQTLDFTEWRKEFTRRKRLLPDVKNLIYFHCYIDVSDGAAEKYADSRLLLSDGTQGNYGDSAYKIFLPVAGSAYARDIAKNVDLILNPPDKGGLGYDGVYWDEMAYSRYRYHYGQPWDGVSADIDPKTMQITRLKSSVSLITQPWRVALAKHILSLGPLIGNGNPHTRTMAELHFPRFLETGSISNLVLGQLYTPIALGDHLTERSEEDAYHDMVRGLDYGAVYYWYNDLTVDATYPTLTSYMFAITPVELHEGYIIGRERILTNRSGLFGWGDNSRHEVHVFDDTGHEVKGFKAPTIVRDGKTFTELRIGEGWSAAIVRVAP